MKKGWTPLTLIQVAWVIEVIVLACQTIAAWWVSFASARTEAFSVWLTAVPVLGALVAAQGAAASIGPLVSDKIKAGTKTMPESKGE